MCNAQSSLLVGVRKLFHQDSFQGSPQFCNLVPEDGFETLYYATWGISNMGVLTASDRNLARCSFA